MRVVRGDRSSSSPVACAIQRPSLTASRPDGTSQFFPNRDGVAIRWSMKVGSLLDAFPLSASNGLTHASSVALNFDPLDFLERKFLAGEIVEFSSTRRFVVRDV